MTTQIEMTPLLRRIVAVRYYVILREMRIISDIGIEFESGWSNLVRYFGDDKYVTHTKALEIVWKLVDAIPLTDQGNIDIVESKKGRL